MEGWKERQLSDICEFFADGDWIESKDQSSDGIRLIQTGNIGDGLFKDREDKARYIPKETFLRLRCTSVFPGDCLISRLPDPVGRACIIPEIEEEMITAVDCSIIRFGDDYIIPEFFTYFAQSVEYYKEVDAYCTGATRRRISRKNLGKVKVPLPPLAEQKRIVAILDAAFEAIATATARTEQNLANAREVFEAELDRVFSSPTHTRAELGSVCGFQNGFAFKSKLFKPRGMPVLRISSIRDGEISDHRPVFTDPSDYSEDLSRYIVKDGDLLIAMSGATTGKVGFNRMGSEYLQNQRVGRFLPSRELDISFLYYFLRTKVEENLAISAGSAQPNLSTKQINELLVPLPPISDQKRIVGKIDALAAETQRLESLYRRKLDLLAELKQSLLAKAFRGELTAESEADETLAQAAM